MSKSEILNSVAIPVELNNNPFEPSKASERLANIIRQKYASMKTTIENIDCMNPVAPASVVISEEELTGDLPTTYDETRIVLQARDPYLIWAYWEIALDERKKLADELGLFEFVHTDLVLRVFNKSMNYSFDIKLTEECNDWFINVNDRNCDYYVQLCILIPSEGIRVLATSKVVHTPNDKVSVNLAKWVPGKPPVEVVQLCESCDKNTCIVVANNKSEEAQKVIEMVTITGAYVGGSSEVVYNIVDDKFIGSSDVVDNSKK